jgi:hypothetical protein
LQDKFQDSEEFVMELRERLESNPMFQFFFPLIYKRKKTEERKKGKGGG